jgi:DNA-binding XRE family transcriptional regulator/mannose-6-phosphate isomerase-like protein (cupin superfamily)
MSTRPVSRYPRNTMTSVADQSAAPGAAAEQQHQVAFRIRQARERSGLSLRELARRLDLSASALSQIETGKSRPSVKTLYAIVSELGISLDELFAAPPSAPAGGPGHAAGATSGDGPFTASPGGAAGPGGAAAGLGGFVQRAESRASLELDSGVTWERLTASHDPDVDFLYATYAVGGASSSGDKLVRHSGREYGIVLSGELEVTVGFDTQTLRPGDSLSFSSQEPHRLANRGDVPAVAIWIVIGRRQSDPRTAGFGAESGPS